MNYWQGNNICLRAMEESDADFFYETLQDMDIQKNESDIRVPMSHKACADFAMEQAAKGNDNLSPFLIIEDKEKNRVGMASPSIEDSRVGVFTCGIFIKPEYQRKGYATLIDFVKKWVLLLKDGVEIQYIQTENFMMKSYMD